MPIDETPSPLANVYSTPTPPPDPIKSPKPVGGREIIMSPTPFNEPEPKDVEEHWKRWSKSGKQEHFNSIIRASEQAISRSIQSYAPGSSPAVKSKAKILTARAIRSYDPDKGTKFQTYLHGQLRPLQREANSYHTVSTPEKIRFDLSKLNKLHNEFVDENGREPNDDELADFTNLSKKRIAHIRKYDRSLIGEASFEGDEESASSLPAVKQPEDIWKDFVYSELSDKDKLIFDLRTGNNERGVREPVSKIAKKLGVSASAVSQRLAKIADRMTEGGVGFEV